MSVSKALHTQRWDARQQLWRPAEEPFAPSRYEVIELKYGAAKDFVTAHHHLANWSNDRLRYGLMDTTGEQPRLVGVAVVGIPMHPKVLTNPFPRLTPYYESVELSRLALLEEVPGNAESWTCARAFRMAAEHGVRVSLRAPEPQPGQDLKRWTESALHALGATSHITEGKHRYLHRIGRTRGEASRVVIAMPARPYPRRELRLDLPIEAGAR